MLSYYQKHRNCFQKEIFDMKKKLGIIIPVLLVLVIGGFAAVYFAMPGNTADDTAPLPPVFDQTETPDTRPTTENLSASVELSESELHEIFEEVYLDSVSFPA